MDQRILADGFPLLQILILSSQTRPFHIGLEVIHGVQYPLNHSAYHCLEFLSLSTQVEQLIRNKNFFQTLPRSIKSLSHCSFTQNDTAIDLLTRYSGLQYISLVKDVGASPLYPEATQFQYSHTSLRQLSLVSTSSLTCISPLFRAVQFPNLLHLSLGNIGTPPYILQSIADAAPPLECLELWYFFVPLEQLLQFFERVPTITTLDIRQCRGFNDTLISNLTLSDPNTTRYLPRLKHLDIGMNCGGKGSVSNRDLMTFVESRWRMRVDEFARIEYVAIYDNRKLGDEWSELLSSMKSEGLDCHTPS